MFARSCHSSRLLEGRSNSPFLQGSPSKLPSTPLCRPAHYRRGRSTGHVRRGFGAKRLMDLSIAWSQQWTALWPQGASLDLIRVQTPPRSVQPRPKIRTTLRLERDRGRAVRTNHGPHPDAPCRKSAIHPDRRCGGHSALHCGNSSSTKACKAEKGRRPGGKFRDGRDRERSTIGIECIVGNDWRRLDFKVAAGSPPAASASPLIIGGSPIVAMPLIAKVESTASTSACPGASAKATASPAADRITRKYMATFPA